MPRQSAGILLYRKLNNIIQVFLVHPGGPFWKNKDDGAWSIPKGEYESDEDPLEAAKREFYEETGQYIDGEFIALKPIKQKSGKIVQAYLVEGDIDAANIKSNLFEMEWPPKSGKMQSFPEVDRAGWFTIGEAKVKINMGQVGLVEELTNSPL
ncbi:NUDIX domain-containing protein [Mucilaginibacter ginsenosidivorax]|uniref:NUDIX domain-containing protein n=1 Tax=Mucilaginibacter ginsenosidivorax TaxID=862126 RepID=A0A5B8W6R9_9SPHI|nr:NUDIX domain-containing protein [Mucilaginibacter ginsenosidivorax]QEC79157.1 NUDIX domain-containing protein [Mucilaginibacter ginsenosidivorax]